MLRITAVLFAFPMAIPPRARATNGRSLLFFFPAVHSSPATRPACAYMHGHVSHTVWPVRSFSHPLRLPSLPILVLVLVPGPLLRLPLPPLHLLSLSHLLLPSQRAGSVLHYRHPHPAILAAPPSTLTPPFRLRTPLFALRTSFRPSHLFSPLAPGSAVHYLPRARLHLPGWGGWVRTRISGRWGAIGVPG